MGGECPYGHEWTHYNSTCPYGRSLPGSVTLPNLADLTFDMQVATILCVGWSLLPFVIMGLGAVQAILSRGTRLWSFMIFAVSITVLNELILKRIFQMPRPYQSCSTSCGMPSGHSTLAMGFLALCVHDIIYLYNSQDTRAELTEESSNYKCRECCATCCGREFWASPWKWLGKDCKTFVSPLSGDVYLTRRHEDSLNADTLRFIVTHHGDKLNDSEVQELLKFAKPDEDGNINVKNLAEVLLAGGS